MSNSSLKTFLLHIFSIFLSNWSLVFLKGLTPSLACLFLLSFVDCSFFLLPSCCACLQILRANRQLVRVCFTVECMYLQGVNESTVRMTPDILVCLICVLCTLFHSLLAQKPSWYDMICVCTCASGHVCQWAPKCEREGWNHYSNYYTLSRLKTQLIPFKIVKLAWQEKLWTDSWFN